MTTDPRKSKLEVLAVVHTHWDREWYLPEPQFRQRLVALIDSLLDGTTTGPFLLDGQSVLLEDYLRVRPERAADLSAALRTGLIEAGPWYVLADELIPSGEGLVRNLLAGARVLGSLRATAPPVLYCPDSFGHPAMLPALAAGFGCPLVVLWRGYGGARHPAGDTARWNGPDGSSVLLFHLPPDGYEFGSNLPVDGPGAERRWARIRSVLGPPRSAAGLSLLTVGADHHAPPQNLPQALNVLASAAGDDCIRRSSLSLAGAALVARAATLPLPTVSGELRDSYGYTWTLQGTFGTRTNLKRRYKRVERELLRDVEPWVALADRMRKIDRRHLLRSAWQPILLSQPHDTLCGCSIDAVARAMDQRLEEATAAASSLREASLADLLGHDPVTAREARDRWSPAVVVRNPACRPRGGLAELDLDMLLAESPVGPQSAGVIEASRRPGAVSVGTPALPIQVLGTSRRFVREDSRFHYPVNRLIERRRVLVWVPEVPAYGMATFPLVGRRGRSACPVKVTGSGTRISSRTATVEIKGESLLLHGDDGRIIPDWLTLEAEGERGDLYTGSTISGTKTLGVPVRCRVTARGPLRAELSIDWKVVVPTRILASAAGESRRIRRQVVRVRTRVQMDAASRLFRVLVQGDNSATDVRLRLVFRTGLRTPVVHADAAFATVVRSPLIGGVAGNEVPPATSPMHRFVTLSSGHLGATVFSDGLAEYEAREDGSVALTLLRAVGELSRADLPERPGHAGYPTETPDAQQSGPFEAAMGFVLHQGMSDHVRVANESMADDFLHPLTGDTWRSVVYVPERVDGVRLEGNGLVLCAIKPSESGDWTVLRCRNVLSREVTGAWIIPGIEEARLARLDETPLGILPAVGSGGVCDRVAFTAPPESVTTILVR